MQRRSSRLNLRLVAFVCSAAFIVVAFFVPVGSAGWAGENRNHQVATTTPVALHEPSTPLPAAQESGDTGDVIRQRIYSTLAAAAVLTVCSLLLLGAYVSLRDPLRRHWTEIRMREQRRQERRSRHRRS
jgi:hypothetical protein